MTALLRGRIAGGEAPARPLQAWAIAVACIRRGACIGVCPVEASTWTPAQ